MISLDVWVTDTCKPHALWDKLYCRQASDGLYKYPNPWILLNTSYVMQSEWLLLCWKCWCLLYCTKYQSVTLPHIVQLLQKQDTHNAICKQDGNGWKSGFQLWTLGATTINWALHMIVMYTEWTHCSTFLPAATCTHVCLQMILTENGHSTFQ